MHARVARAHRSQWSGEIVPGVSLVRIGLGISSAALISPFQLRRNAGCTVPAVSPRVSRIAGEAYSANEPGSGSVARPS